MEIREVYTRTEGPHMRAGGRAEIGKEELPEGESPQMRLQPNVYALAPDVAGSGEIERGRIVLPLDEQGYLANRKAGDIVISPDSDVQWRKIEEVSFENGEVEWKTSTPKIEDVVREAYFYADVDISNPDALDESDIELATPYLEGPLAMFDEQGQTTQTRRQGQDAPECEDCETTCELPKRCELKDLHCGTTHCPCSSSACNMASQCVTDPDNPEDYSLKFCESVDTCNVDGLGPPRQEHPGSCHSPGQVDAFSISSRCTETCSDDSDCPGDLKCGKRGFCAENCQTEGNSSQAPEQDPQDNLLTKVLDTILDGAGAGNLQGLEVSNHAYFDADPNMRLSIDVDLWPPSDAGVTISAVAEADLLAGLGLRFDFEETFSETIGPAQERITLFTFNVLGAQFYVRLELHGRLKFETTAQGMLKIDYKLYSTRQADSCESADCDDFIKWKDHDANWDDYERDHSGGAYGGPPSTEDNEDDVMGTYAQDAGDSNHGLAFGTSVGSNPGCMGYEDRFCESKSLLGFFDANLIKKKVTTSLFGIETDATIENYLTGEAGANVGLYGPVAPTNRLVFIEPVNFLASAYAIFDPPFCGFGFDLLYRAFIGIGPLDLFGLLELGKPDGVKFPFFSPIPILTTSWKATPQCYVPDGGDEPLQPAELNADSGQSWNDVDWENTSFGCDLIRGIAQAGSGASLACGAPKDHEPADTSGTCATDENCPDEEACLNSSVCVPEPNDSLRVSLVGGSQNQGVNLSIVKPSGDRVTLDVVDEEAASSFATVATQVIEDPASGVYEMRVTNAAGQELSLDNVPYQVKLVYKDEQGEKQNVQRVEGFIQKDEANAPVKLRYRHQP